jgi:hypothetical protein
VEHRDQAARDLRNLLVTCAALLAVPLWLQSVWPRFRAPAHWSLVQWTFALVALAAAAARGAEWFWQRESRKRLAENDSTSSAPSARGQGG